jgi:hypothetical protein
MMSCNMSALYVPHQKKRLTNIDGVDIIGGNSHSSPRLVLIRQFCAIVVSVPTEKHNRYIFTYVITYPPSDVHAFNAMWTTLHMLRERIQVLQKWPRDIPRSPHALGAQLWLVTWRIRNPYRMIGTILKQASSWGGGSGIYITQREELTFLPFRWCVITESKLHKVNPR